MRKVCALLLLLVVLALVLSGSFDAQPAAGENATAHGRDN